MNVDGLSAAVQANRGPLLAAAGAGVVGLALYRRRKAGGNTAAPAAAPALGSVSAGGQVGAMTGAGPYDSTASDVYGLVQPQMEALGQQVSALSGKLNAVPVSSSPIASSMYAPRGTGQYVVYGDGSVREVESDGSTYHLTPSEWGSITQANGGTMPYAVPITGPAPNDYSGPLNLRAKVTAASAQTS